MTYMQANEKFKSSSTENDNIIRTKLFGQLLQFKDYEKIISDIDEIEQHKTELQSQEQQLKQLQEQPSYLESYDHQSSQVQHQQVLPVEQQQSSQVQHQQSSPSQEHVRQQRSSPKTKKYNELQKKLEEEEQRTQQSVESINKNVSDQFHLFVSTNIDEHENYKRLFNVLIDTAMKQIAIPPILDDSEESKTIVNPVPIHLNIMEILQNYYKSNPNMIEINFTFPQHTITYKPDTEISGVFGGVFGKKRQPPIITVTPDPVTPSSVSSDRVSSGRKGGSRRLRRKVV